MTSRERVIRAVEFKGPDRTQSQAAQDTASALLAAKRARRQK